MGIRKSYGKNKKSKKPIGAITVKRDENVRRAGNSKSIHVVPPEPEQAVSAAGAHRRRRGTSV